MSGAVLRHVCVSARKGIPKHAVGRMELRAGHGIVGDAHAGDWHRQVSLLDQADIDLMEEKGLNLAPGAFGENLVVHGLDFADLGIGTRIAVGEAELEITQIGKVCHTRCAIYEATGDCVMPRAGVFAEVRRGGDVAPGAPVRVLEHVPRTVVQVAVLTASDRCAAGATRDTSGPAVAAELADALRAHVAWAGVVADERGVIATRLADLASRSIHLVVTVGGTGLAARDVTPDATRDVVEREVPGLAEAMRAASARITPNALLSRAVVGTLGGTLIVNLPGSRRAALENLRAILPALPHAFAVLRGGEAHPEADAARTATPDSL